MLGKPELARGRSSRDIGDRSRGIGSGRAFKVAIAFAAAVVLVVTAAYLLTGPSPEVQEASGTLELPPPQTTGAMSVEEAIARRRSIRSYTDEPLSLEDISQLLWAAQGITEPSTGGRAAPSARGTYPMEVYVVVGTDGVTGLAEGVYHYDPRGHRLENILEGDVRQSLMGVALGQSCVGDAPVDIVIAAIYERTTGRYGDRGIRYVHMEAGHIGQNLYLQAVARGLGMVVIGAFDDEGVQQVLRLPSEQKPLYIIPVGHPGE
jgi:SagB-type dehydrogenase family enzyme